MAETKRSDEMSHVGSFGKREVIFESWSTKYDLWTSSVDRNWELVNKAQSWVATQAN